MGRRPRKHQCATGGYYHVMNRGHNREVVFQSEDDHAYFLDLVDRYRQRFAVRLYHYCLLDNHFHLLARAEQAEALSPCMAGLLRLTYIIFTAAMASWATCGRDASKARSWRWRHISSVAPATSSATPWKRAWWRNPGRTAGPVARPTPWADPTGCCPTTSGTRSWERMPGSASSCWREFLLGDDPQEALVRRRIGSWATKATATHAACEARPARRRGRPLQPPPGQEGFFPQFYQ